MSGLHHPFGPSSLSRVLNCPGSYLATKDLPDTDSPAALSGTATHALVEHCRETDTPPQKFFGTTLDVKRLDGTFSYHLVDRARVDSATMFVDHVNGLPGVDFNEQKIQYRKWVPQPAPGAFGTLDAARGNDGTVYVRDFKDGQMLVEAKDNEQLLGCALGFYEDYGHLFDIKEFNLGIVQPRLDNIDIWVVSLEYVLNWAETVLKPGAAAALLPGAPFKPGEHCTFCKIRGTCKAQINQTFKQLAGDFEDLDEALDGVAMAPPLVGRYTNEEVAKILPMLPLMMKSLKDLKAYAFAEVANGRAVGDMKIVAGRGERNFRQNVNAVEVLKVDGVTDAQLYEPPQLRSIKQLENVIGKDKFKPPTKTKDAGPYYDLIEMKRGKPTLAAGDDKREAITLLATDTFEDLEDEE